MSEGLVRDLRAFWKCEVYGACQSIFAVEMLDDRQTSHSRCLGSSNKVYNQARATGRVKARCPIEWILLTAGIITIA